MQSLSPIGGLSKRTNDSYNVSQRFATLVTYTFVLLSVVWLSASLPAQDDAPQLIELVTGLLKEADADVRGLAYEQVRTSLPGTEATKQLGELLSTLSGEQQIGLIRALGERGDEAAKPAIIRLIETPDSEPVLIASITALGQLGSAEDCHALCKRIGDDEAAKVRAAAQQALVALRDSAVNDALLEIMGTANPALKVKLIDVLARRRALSSRNVLLEEALGSDPTVRRAAMTALGKIGEPEQIPGMVKAVLKAERGSERAAAEKNVMFVCQRIENEDERAAPLLAAMGKLPADDYAVLLSTLGRVGGPQAKQVVTSALKNRKTHSAALRALANWPDSDVADDLVRLAKSDNHPGHRVTALRAVIRISPLPDGRTEEQKLELLKTAMELCQRDQDRSYALQRAAAIRSVETLRFLLPFLDNAKFTEAACLSIVELAHHRNLREPHKEEFHAALDQVMATSKDATVVDRANRYKNNQTWVRPK